MLQESKIIIEKSEASMEQITRKEKSENEEIELNQTQYMSLTIQISGWWQGWDKIWADEAHALPALLPQHTASSCLPLCLRGTPEPFQSHRSLRFCFSLLSQEQEFTFTFVKPHTIFYIQIF